MARWERLPLGWGWRPGRLGYSIPLAEGMWRSRLVGLTIGLIAFVAINLGIHRLYYPQIYSMSATEARQAVHDQLGGLNLPVWDPGGQLSRVALPHPHLPPLPPSWPGSHPADMPLSAEFQQRLDQGRRLIQADSTAAAGRLNSLVRLRPQHWAVRYNLGISLLHASLWKDAAHHLGKALQRLEGLEEKYDQRAEHQAAIIYNRYALGRALLEDGNCVRSIRTIKSGIRSLTRFLEVSELEVYDRYLPFTVAPTSFDSSSMWLLLTHAYVGCEGSYPAEYFRRYPDAGDFLASEYSDPYTSEIQEGPFPNELSWCIANNGSESRCWALAQLNRIYYASRQLYPDLYGEAPASLQPFWPRMAAIAYEIARLAAERDLDRRGAAIYLRQAAILSHGSADNALSQRITDLGRYLAAEFRDFSYLAVPYRYIATEDLPFAETTSPEELKGLAWQLKERCETHLRKGNPEAISAAIAQVQRALEGSGHLPSLDQWQRQTETALQDRLLRAMAERQRYSPTAVAIRDYRADFLGVDWPSRARQAWIDLGLIFRGVLYLTFFLATIAAWWLIHRYVVYPYLLYTCDYYKTEFRHRYKQRRLAHRPFIGKEIRDYMEARE